MSDISEGGDDITLEDLVAMETMEDDICDDDNYYQVLYLPYSGHNYSNFCMNLILSSFLFPS